MKKILITSLAALPAITFAAGHSSATTHAFTGFNLGLGAGISSFRLPLYITSSGGQTDVSESSTSWAAEAFAAYNFQWTQHWLTGLQLNYQYNANDAVSRSTTVNHFMPQHLWGGTVRLGFAPSSSHYFYAEAGPEWLRMKAPAKENNVSLGTLNYTKVGYNIGLGMVQKLSEHFYAGAHVNYYGFSSKTLSHSSTVTTKVKTNLLNFMLDIGYQF